MGASLEDKNTSHLAIWCGSCGQCDRIRILINNTLTGNGNDLGALVSPPGPDKCGLEVGCAQLKQHFASVGIDIAALGWGRDGNFKCGGGCDEKKDT